MKLEFLRRQLNSGAFPHAYLFSGSDEAGKEAAIELVLRRFFGESRNLNPDFMEIRNDPITIEDVRALKSRAYSAPLVGNKNVFLMRSLENLSREAAPALLKILEEPPQSLIILAETKNRSLVLPTLKSRFSQLIFAGAPRESIEQAENIDSALWYFERKTKKSPNPQNIAAFERALWVKEVLNNPTSNKRLLNEYVSLIR